MEVGRGSYGIIDVQITFDILEADATFLINPGEDLPPGLEIVNAPCFVVPEEGTVKFVVYNSTGADINLYPRSRVANLTYVLLNFEEVEVEER